MTPYSEFAHTGTIQGRDELSRINKYRVQQASMVSITRTHKRRSLKQRISLGVFTNKHDESMMKKRGSSWPRESWQTPPRPSLEGSSCGGNFYEITPTCQG